MLVVTSILCTPLSLNCYKQNSYSFALMVIHMLFQIVEFISVLLSVGSESAEKKLIDLGAIQRILDLFFA